MGLRGRLALALLLSSLAAVVLVAGLGTVLSARFLEDAARADLRRQAQAGAELATVPVRGGTTRPLAQPEVRRALERLDITIVTSDPSTLEQPIASLLDDQDVRRLRRGDPIDGVGEVDGTRVAFSAVPGRPIVVAYRALDRVQEASRAVGQRLLLAGLLAVALAGVIGLWLGGHFARPVRELEDTVGAIGRGDLERRVDPGVSERSDEVGDLARGIDRMRTALAEARTEQRAFFRSVAHELRTPLTNIRGYAEGLVDGSFAGREGHAAAVVLEESVRLQRLVEDVMTLARLDVGDLVVEPRELDVHDALQAAAAAARPIADEAGIELAVEADRVPVTTDPDRVRQVLDNLVANALRVVPTGGRIELRATAAGGDGVRVQVADSGPGIDDRDLAVVFERYELWRRHRGVRDVGSGLGLAIVAELARRLGGSVSVDGHGDLGGATFVVDLPSIRSGAA